jgi:serine protease Do
MSILYNTKGRVFMKKLFISLLVATIFFSTAAPVLASDNNIVIEDSVRQIKKAEKRTKAERKKVSEVIDEVNGSVVAVIGRNTKVNESSDYEYSKFPRNLQHGSGVVISADGKLITNNHVIDGLEDIYVVTYDGKVYQAELLYTDEEIDLAIIQINRSDLKPIKMCSEADTKVGDDVIAVGTPLFFGYRNSATKGIVSGLNRPVDGTYTYLQTDAAINPGNSGGPLVNMKGELVGINTLGYTYYQGMNFSIPVSNINYFLEHYNNFGRIKRCFTGIEFEENWAAMLGLPTNQGLKVVAVRKDAVVTNEVVKEGDLLEAIDGKMVTSIAQYNEILMTHLPGDKVTLTFARKDTKFDVYVELAEQLKIEKNDGEKVEKNE